MKTFSIKTGGLPMKKVLKIIMVVIMILGIAFSISNYISMELKAKGSSLQGIDYDGECIDKGTECDLIEIP